MKPEETIDFHIRCAWLKISKMYNQEALRHGLTQATGFVLLNIDPKGGTPSTRLGPLMGMEPTSLSRTLKSMEEKGWICRVDDNSDRRITRITLTAEGKKFRNISKQVVVSFNQRLLNVIPHEKLEHFREVMEIINKHTNQQPQKTGS